MGRVMRKHLIGYLILGLMAARLNVHAERLNFRTYSVKDGLGQSTIFSLCESSDGYLWVGTDGGGLARFDGFEFETFTEQDGLSDNVVYSILEDHRGHLWIGTASGVTVFDGYGFRPLAAPDSIIDEEVWHIAEDPDGSLWFATYGDGLVHYADGDLISLSTADGMPDNDVRHISVDGSGKIWGATPRGAFVMDKVQTTILTTGDGLPSNIVNATAEDASGARWFATNQGIARFDGETWTAFTSDDGLADDEVWRIFAEPDGNIWFTTSNGVSRFNGREFHNWTTLDGLPHPVVEMMLRDREKNLWLATDAGLARFSGCESRSIGVRDGLPDGNVWGFWWDRSGLMWIATELDLVRYDSRLGRVVPSGITITRRGAYPLKSDGNGDLLFGADGTLYHFDGKQNRDMGAKFDLPEISVLAIEEDRRGQLWIGTEQNGVLILSDEGPVRKIEKKDGLVSIGANAILEDQTGRIWIATNHGVNWHDGDSLHAFAMPTSVQDRFVMALAEDDSGMLWFATYGEGVVGYDPEIENTVSVTSSDGLIDDAVLSLQMDSDQMLWIGTNRGVSTFDTDHFRRNGTIKVESYGYTDGFTGVECNQGAMAMDGQGSIWVGTIDGAFRIDPRQEIVNAMEPATHITGISLFLEPLIPPIADYGNATTSSFPRNLSLPASQNHLTFDYTGICLTSPERVRFMFKLDGFDTEWSPVTTQRRATYSNLPPGDFTFLVKACNNDGLWNHNPAWLKVRILTPWWRAKWFTVLAAILAGGVVVGAYGLRTRSHRRMRRKLEGEVEARTLELHQEKLKVERINKELEDRVRERTEKLDLANEKLVRAKKMEVLGQLASGVAHDLNNILSGIVTYPDLLLMKLSPDSPHRADIAAIKRSGEKAAGVVQDLLTLARRSIKSETEVDLNEIIREYMTSPEHLQLMADHSPVEVRYELESRLPKIIGSQVHLSKSVMNLVTNAVEAIPPTGGSVRITTCLKEIDITHCDLPLCPRSPRGCC